MPDTPSPSSPAPADDPLTAALEEIRECSPDHKTQAGGENQTDIVIEDNQDKDCFSIRYTDPGNGEQDLIHFCDWPALKAAVDKHQAERGGRT